MVQRSDWQRDVLLTLLEERGRIARNIRERSEKFALWVAGLGLSTAGIIYAGKLQFQLVQKHMALAAAGVLGLGVLWQLVSLHIGFNSNRECLIRVESALGLYDKDLYVEGTSIYSEAYRSKPILLKRAAWHFPVMYMWIVIVVGILVSAILTAPCSNENLQVPQHQETSVASDASVLTNTARKEVGNGELP